jgi:spore germination protein
MKTFEYADQGMGVKEISMSVSSMIIGVGVLTLPRALAEETNAFDGWMSIILGGIIAGFFAWVLAKLASRFPGKTFFEYTSLIVSRPIACMVTFFMSGYFLLFVAYEIRSVGTIAKLYLFERTPVEVITLVFLLVTVYAVSGARVGVIRLNLLFFPIVLLIILFVFLFTTDLLQKENLKPFFTTNPMSILKGTQQTVYSFLGFEILLFYTAFMKRPKDAPKAAIIGILIPTILYLAIFLFTIGVFTNVGTKNLIYPTIELAKEVEVPGGFFERVESMFFVIWLMTIFNTTTMAWDVAVWSAESMFPKINKMTWLLILAPIIYLGAMTPQDLVQLFAFGDFISLVGIVIGLLMPTSLLLIALFRGVKGNG